MPDRKRPVDPEAALLALVRAQPEALAKQLRGLDPQQVADRVQSLPARVREEVLLLVEHPEQVVPLLSELELVSTLRSTGLDAQRIIE